MPKQKAVSAWFSRYDNPMKDVMQRVREVILAADPRMDECIKWQAPTFTYRGNLASFFPKAKAQASLMFHEGARIPGKHPRLEGTAELGRVMRFSTLGQVDSAKDELERVVRAWCDWREELGADAAPARAKAAPAKKAARAAPRAPAKAKPKPKVAKKRA